MSRADANLYSRFAAHFPVNRERVLLRTPGGTSYSYADAERESGRFANFIARLGLQPGDRVTAQIQKSPQALWLYLACLRAGFVFHPLNPAYTAAEVAYFLEDAAPSLVVFDPTIDPDMPTLADRYRIPHRYTLLADGQGTLLDASHGETVEFNTRECASTELAALLYSSGTTGKPKGIMLTHANLGTNSAALCAAWGFTADDVLLHALPIFHVHGLFIALGCALMSGAQLQFLDKFDVDEVLRTLPHSTVMMGVPTYYTRLLASPRLGPEICANIRLFTCGSAPLTAPTFAEFEMQTGHTILERYGMTETSIITTNPLHGARKAGSVGIPLDGVELRLVDDSGISVDRGVVGHVQVRGPSVFAGYWRKPEKTAGDFTEDGYFNTGDDGIIDDDGYLSLIGRSKDLIISGGLNVYPIEVEQVVDALPEIAESAVIGLPDADFGEQVVAVLVLEQGAVLDDSSIRERLKRELAAFKVPKRYVAVDALPRNSMGKVQKNLLRERFGKQ